MLNYGGQSFGQDYGDGMVAVGRQEERIPLEAEEVFIKFKLHFLPEQEMVGRVIDMSPLGISFKLDGIKEGLIPGTPLKNVMVVNDGQQKQISNASVVYCNRIPFGNPNLFLTGIKFNLPAFEQSILRRNFSGSYSVRLPRYENGMWERLYGPVKWNINFVSGEEKFSSKELVNISKCGVAVKFSNQEGSGLKKDDVLNNFCIFLGNEIVYFGKANIIDIKENNNCRVVRCAVRDYINLEKAFSLAQTKKETRDINYFISEVEKLKMAGKEFKSEIADLKLFLEKIKEKLDSKEEELNKKSNGNNKEKEYKIVLDGICDSVFPVLNKYFFNIWELVKDLNEDEYNLHKQYFQKQVLDLFLLCPFNSRALHKPLGYAGDYIMMDMLYNRSERGDSLFSRLINKHANYQKMITSKRNGIAFIREKFDELIKANQEKPVKVMIVGSGPAKEIREEILNNSINIEKYHFTLVDADRNALLFSQRMITELLTETEKKIEIEYVNKSVAELIRENGVKSKANTYDLIYSLGLFDYFSLSLSKRFVTCLFDFLKPGKKLIIGNLNHSIEENKVYMDFILEWPVLYRTKDDMLKYIEQLAGPKNIYFETDKTKATNFLIIEK